jgi:hypothetical protein
MKKTVRIRKAKKGETPGYLNKTKQFLEKAQKGMSVGNSGQDQQMFQQMYTSAYNSLISDTPADIVYYELINNYGADANMSQLVIQAAIKQLMEEGYINPEPVGEEQQAEASEQSDPTGSNDEDMAEQQEEEQLMMSESEEDNSHISDYAAEDNFDEQQMQQQAFKYGGYFNEGGYAQQDPNLNQYGSANNNGNQKPFSIEDLVQQQAGVQFVNPQSSMINDYLPDYNPVSNGWENQNWLSEGEVPQELPKAQTGKNIIKGIKKGYDWYNKVPQIQGASALGKLLPINTAVGYGLSKIPRPPIGSWKGKTIIKDPKLESYFTQNVMELQSILNNKEKVIDTSSAFSKNKITGDLSVDRLTMPSKAIQDILVKGNTEGRSSFTLEDVIPVGRKTIGGVYPANSKISLGEDDLGLKFFDISHTYKPGDQGAYFGIPSDATKTSFRNRFYYEPNEAGTFNVYDENLNLIENGTNTMFQVTRPIVPSLYKSIMGSSRGDVKTSGALRSLISRKEFTATPPNSFGQLNAGHKVGRGLEQLGVHAASMPFATIGSVFGYNPVRTRAKHIKDMSEPIFSYKKPGTTSMPLDDVNTAEDIRRISDYYRRKGRNVNIGAALIGAGGLTYALWPNGENVIDLDGDKVEYLPKINKFKGYNIPNEDIVDPGVDYNMMNTLDYDTIQKKQGGTISKKKFTKNLLAFYKDGGANPNDSNTIGKGNRMDTGTREVEKIVSNFVGNLQKGSNEATTSDIYDLAKGNPEIMQTLMSNGKQEDLTNPTEMQYSQEGGGLQNNGNQMEEIIGQVQGALESGAQPEEVMMQLLQGGLEPEAVAQIFVQLGMPEEQVVQVMQQIMSQGQQQPQGMGPSEEEMMAMQQQQMQAPAMMQLGGFTDMDAENPLTKFISGGMESEYYEPYDMPQADDGIQVNRQCGYGQMWNERLQRCVPMVQYNTNCVPMVQYNTNYIQGPGTSGGVLGALLPWNRRRNNRYMQLSNFTGNTAGPVSRVDFKNNWLGRPKKGTVYFGEGNFGENPNTGGGNTGGVYDNIANNAYDNIANAFDNVASNMSNRKNNKYEKYLGEGNFGKDYWEDPNRKGFNKLKLQDRYGEGWSEAGDFEFGEDDYIYGADSMRDMVVGKRSQKQLNKLYKSEDKQRFQDARQTARQTRRTNRRNDRAAAKIIENQEYGGYIPAYRNGGVSGPGGYMGPMGPNGGITPFTQTYIDDYNSGNSGFLDENNNGISDYIERPDNQSGSADFNIVGPKNYEAGVNVFNAGARGVAKGFENAGSNKGKFNNTLNLVAPENNLASANFQDKGDNVATIGQDLGLPRVDQTGFEGYGKYGGYMEDGGYMQDENVPPGYHMMPNGMIMPDNQMKQGGTNSPYYDEGQEVFMTQDQLNNYLASGGQVEYLY